jgi:hypothetical protein
MRKLTKQEIQSLANLPNVKETPVWNFLGTAHHCGTYLNALANLDMDAKLYRWNQETIRAIYNGLRIANES